MAQEPGEGARPHDGEAGVRAQAPPDLLRQVEVVGGQVPDYPEEVRHGGPVVPPPLPKEPEPSGDGTCDQELMDAVNNYEPFINIPYLNCGTWYTQQFHSSGKIMLLFKNGCTPTFKAVISVTMKNSDWDMAKTTLYADGV